MIDYMYTHEGVRGFGINLGKLLGEVRFGSGGLQITSGMLNYEIFVLQNIISGSH